MLKRRPTAAELEILQVLWSRGSSTVREVHEQLAAEKPTGYTTVLKLMQIMAEKGLVGRDEKSRAHVYSARVAREQTQSQWVRELLEKVFGGSASSLVMHALSGRKTSAEEFAEIRRTLDEMEGKRK